MEGKESFLFKLLFEKWEDNIFFTLPSLQKKIDLQNKKKENEKEEIESFQYKEVLKNAHNLFTLQQNDPLPERDLTSRNDKEPNLTSRGGIVRKSSKKTLLENTEHLFIYISHRNQFVELEKSKYGSFFDDHAYLVFHFPLHTPSSLQLYFWRGTKASPLLYPLFLYQYLPLITSSFSSFSFKFSSPKLVDSHREPSSFLSIFKKNIAIYHSSSSFHQPTQLFCVYHLFHHLPLKMIEISPPSLSTFNSKYAYLMRNRNESYLWIGNYLHSFHANPNLNKEHYTLPYFYANSKFNCQIVYEGKEGKEFQNLFSNTKNNLKSSLLYSFSFWKHYLQYHPVLRELNLNSSIPKSAVISSSLPPFHFLFSIYYKESRVCFELVDDLQPFLLHSNRCYLFYTFSLHIFIWEGKECNPFLLQIAHHLAKQSLFQHDIFKNFNPPQKLDPSSSPSPTPSNNSSNPPNNTPFDSLMPMRELSKIKINKPFLTKYYSNFNPLSLSIQIFPPSSNPPSSSNPLSSSSPLSFNPPPSSSPLKKVTPKTRDLRQLQRYSSNSDLKGSLSSSQPIPSSSHSATGGEEENVRQIKIMKIKEGEEPTDFTLHFSYWPEKEDKPRSPQKPFLFLREKFKILTSEMLEYQFVMRKNDLLKYKSAIHLILNKSKKSSLLPSHLEDTSERESVAYSVIPLHSDQKDVSRDTTVDPFLSDSNESLPLFTSPPLLSLDPLSSTSPSSLQSPLLLKNTLPTFSDNNHSPNNNDNHSPNNNDNHSPNNNDNHSPNNNDNHSSTSQSFEISSSNQKEENKKLEKTENISKEENSSIIPKNKPEMNDTTSPTTITTSSITTPTIEKSQNETKNEIENKDQPTLTKSQDNIEITNNNIDNNNTIDIIDKKINNIIDNNLIDINIIDNDLNDINVIDNDLNDINVLDNVKNKSNNKGDNEEGSVDSNSSEEERKGIRGKVVEEEESTEEDSEIENSQVELFFKEMCGEKGGEEEGESKIERKCRLCDGHFGGKIRRKEIVFVENEFFHCKCLICCDCKKEIKIKEGLIPFEDAFYCVRCFQKNKLETCFQCKKKIEEKIFLQVEQFFFHDDCFECSRCKVKLKNENGYSKDKSDSSLFICPPCAISLQNDEYCEGCGNEIQANQDFIEIPFHQRSKLYHDACFCCFRCKDVLQESYEVHENHLYCLSCFRFLNNLTCQSCKDPILSTFISLGNLKWHSTCFACSKCNSSEKLKDGFIEENGLPCTFLFFLRFFFFYIF